MLGLGCGKIFKDFCEREKDIPKTLGGILRKRLKKLFTWWTGQIARMARKPS
jgi:hypothetical protein